MASRNGAAATSFTAANAGFKRWDQFYKRADAVLNQLSSTSSNNNATAKKSVPNGKKNRGKLRKQKVNAKFLPSQKQDSPQVVISHLESVLSSLNSLLSNLGIPQREYATQEGALSVIVRCCQVYLSLPDDNTNSTQVVTMACRSFRLCVFQNVTGRHLCRSNRVCAVLHNLMATFSGDQDVLEDIYTVLAAICLGDDLNTLVASLQFGDFILQQQQLLDATTKDNDAKEPTSASTLCYLQKLFEGINREQEPLLQQWKNREATLLERIVATEQDLLAATQRLQNQQWTQAETAFTRALSTLQEEPGIAQHTHLLGECEVKLLEGRARVRLELEDWEGVLQDVEVQKEVLHPLLLNDKGKAKLVSQCQIIAWTRQSDALKGLRRFEEAQEALESVMTVMEGSSSPLSVQSFSCLPSDPEITLNSLRKKWNQLQLAKAKCKTKSTTKSSVQKHSEESSSPSTELGRTGTTLATTESGTCDEGQDEVTRAHERQPQSDRFQEEQQWEQHACIHTTSCASSSSSSTKGHSAMAEPGTYVQCLYGTGTVQEVRQCGTTKIQLLSWSPGRQAPTAYLMPGYFTVLGGDGVDAASE